MSLRGHDVRSRLPRDFAVYPFRLSQSADRRLFVAWQQLALIRAACARPPALRLQHAEYHTPVAGHDCGPDYRDDDVAHVTGSLNGSLLTWVEEQLGLKLTRAREPVDVLVIDSVRLPDPD